MSRLAAYYLDSSVALHALLPAGDPRAAHWLAQTWRSAAVYSSTLLEVELVRTLRRDGLAIERVAEVTEHLTSLRLSDQVLRAAAAIEPHIRTLDAIHLATCDLLGPDAVLVTHDARMAQVAREVGRATVDPLA